MFFWLALKPAIYFIWNLEMIDCSELNVHLKNVPLVLSFSLFNTE